MTQVTAALLRKWLQNYTWTYTFYYNLFGDSFFLFFTEKEKALFDSMQKNDDLQQRIDRLEGMYMYLKFLTISL